MNDKAKDEQEPQEGEVEIDVSKDFFGCRVFLNDSGVLHREQYACGLAKVYTFGPSFPELVYHSSMRYTAEAW